MFRTWASSFCCSTENEVNLQIELLGQNDLYGYPRAEGSQRTEIKNHRGHGMHSDHSLDPRFDLTGHYFYIFVDMNHGEILNDQDFLYITEPLQHAPCYMDELNTDNIMTLALNRFNSNAAFCNLHLSKLLPYVIYQIHFYRKHATTGKLTCMYKTKKLKVVSQNRASVCSNTSEFVLVYENEPEYINSGELNSAYYLNSMRSHHKHAKSLMETGSASSKAAKSQNLNESYKGHRNSFFNSTLPYSDTNNQSCNHTNKNSVHENIYSTHNGSKIGSFIEPRKSPAPAGRLPYGGQPREQADVSNCNLSKDESLINVNETFIVNADPENDDYVKKICSILSENLSNNQIRSQDTSIVIPAALSRVRSRNQTQVQPIDLKSSKIFKLVKQQEQKRHASGLTVKDRNRSQHLEDSPSLFTSGKKQKSCTLFLESGELEKENLNPQFNLTAEKKAKHLQYNASAVRRPLADRVDQAQNRNISLYSENETYGQFSTGGGNNYNYLNEPRSGVFDPFMANYCLPNFEKEIIVETLDEMNDLEEVEMSDSSKNHHNTPRKSLKVSATLSEKKTSQSVDFSFTTNMYPIQVPADMFRVGEPAKRDPSSEGDSTKVTPRLTNVDFKTMYMPMYCERLYTVEEVCSPSKEGSTGGDTHFKSFYSRSARKNTRNNNFTNTSMRMKTSDIYAVSEANEYEDGLLNNSPSWQRASSNVSSDRESMNDLLLTARKFEELGFCVECDTTDCTFKLKRVDSDEPKLVYRWYNNTQEHDLSSFFEDIYLSLKSQTLASKVQKDEYVML